MAAMREPTSWSSWAGGAAWSATRAVLSTSCVADGDADARRASAPLMGHRGDAFRASDACRRDVSGKVRQDALPGSLAPTGVNCVALDVRRTNGALAHQSASESARQDKAAAPTPPSAVIRGVAARRSTPRPMKTPTGHSRVSTPEITALDLMRCRKGSGSIDFAATVTAQLAERLNPVRLAEVAHASGEIAIAQRLGYRLERTGHADRATALGARALRPGALAALAEDGRA
jgi:hypothetical protein